MGWKDNVHAVLKKHGHRRVNGKPASHKTQLANREVLCNLFTVLHALGMQVQEPRNIGRRHIEAAVRHWWFVKSVSPKTLQSYLSRLRVIFHTWLNKPGLVPHASVFLADVDPDALVVKTATRASKSWAEAGIDVVEKLREADALNPRLGLMLRMQLAFGLRRKEVLRCRPWVDQYSDGLRAIETKGRRPRTIPIETEVQRQVLALAQLRIPRRQALGWPTMENGAPANFDQQDERYGRYMRKLGLTRTESGATGHGLRAQYAENEALLTGFVPGTLGGTPGQMPADVLLIKKLQVSEALGHSRPEVTAAYYGTLSRRADAVEPEHFSLAMERALALLRAHAQTALPPVERRADCAHLVVVTAERGVALTLAEAHALWRCHSARHGADWIAPADGAAAALEAAANGFICASLNGAQNRQGFNGTGEDIAGNMEIPNLNKEIDP